MMPWLKIIISSGYDEFESAQKAISLSVDLYLLKPVQSTDLIAAIQKMKGQLEERRRRGHLPEGYNRDEVKHALYQHFMQQLYFGDGDTGQLLSRAASLGVEMIHPYYQVVLFQCEATNKRDKHWQQKIAMVLPDRRSSLYYFNEPDQLILLVYAKSDDILSKTVYRLVNIIRHELQDSSMLKAQPCHQPRRGVYLPTLLQP